MQRHAGVELSVCKVSVSLQLTRKRGERRGARGGEEGNMGVSVPQVELSSGRRMPALGLGTASYPQPPSETFEAAVLDAIDLGYRHFDTASIYGSERPLGRALAVALDRGLVGSRDELFVTTKLWVTDMHRDRVVPALRRSLEALGLEYVDLYLIHIPIGAKGDLTTMPTPKDVIPADIPSIWEGMEECYQLGLAKSIGVSNFTCKKLSELLPHVKIPLAVNQVEVHPLWQQKNLRELCVRNSIHVSAYSPLGGIGNFWGTDAVLSAEAIREVAQSLGKTPAQVSLRWGIEQGLSVLPKSYNKGRLKENMEIFDWQLRDEDVQKLSNVPQKRMVLQEQFVSPEGLIKSHAEFWDGEI